MNTLAMTGMAVAAIAGAANAELMYTFDSDAQGWGSINDTSSFTWQETLGNPGGAVEGVDQVSGDIWYFSAPAMDLGDLSGAYGETLMYDILGTRGNQTSIGAVADVMLVGGGLEIGVNFGVQPTTSGWTSWSVVVDESADWRMVSNILDGGLSATQATAADIQSVLADLDGLYIRGEYTNGSDSAALDNVSLVPAPGAAGLVALGGALALRRRR